MIVADKEVSLILTGTGDVLEPESGIAADGIGSGGNYALAAARALADTEARCRGDRPQGDEDRRRDLRLHQQQCGDREHRLTLVASPFQPIAPTLVPPLPRRSPEVSRARLALPLILVALAPRPASSSPWAGCRFVPAAR